MRKLFSIATLVLMISLAACQNSNSNAQTGSIKETIPVEQFEKKLAQTPGAQLVDVRTPGEYSNGHLNGAVNMNVNGDNYEQQFNTLDKSKPVFVYCKSGGRSGNAANIMQDMGFKEIYNMEGGIMRWEGSGKSVEAGNAPPKPAGMTSAEFGKLLMQKKYVLVDYNAKWCAPCKRMLPMLDAYVAKRKDKMGLVRIDADEHKALLKEKGISGVPYLELYQDGKLVWKRDTEIDEKQLQQEIKL